MATGFRRCLAMMYLLVLSFLNSFIIAEKEVSYSAPAAPTFLLNFSICQSLEDTNSWGPLPKTSTEHDPTTPISTSSKNVHQGIEESTQQQLKAAASESQISNRRHAPLSHETLTDLDSEMDAFVKENIGSHSMSFGGLYRLVIFKFRNDVTKNIIRKPKLILFP